MKTNYSKKQKIVSALLSATLAGSAVLCCAPATAYAAEDATEKEEVVYATLDGSGKVEDVNVVNSFTSADIVDYGDYETVKNLTTTDPIDVTGERISFHTDADKIYYQGELKSTDIPWDIDIRYYLDGIEYQAEELGGKSGTLEIRIKVTQNENCSESFWNGYALQASLSLDTNLCKNIEADEAMIANVGSDKQLSYIILPGKGADLSITADAMDFEMDAISINAIKLSLDFDFDSGELADKIGEVQDAVEELNDGAGELDDGAGELESGTNDLYDGSVTLKDGAAELRDGTAALDEGIDTIEAALNTLNKQSGNLTGGSKEVLKALRTIQNSLSGLKTTSDDLSALSNASAQIQSGIDGLTTLLSKMDTSGADLNENEALIKELNTALQSGELTSEQAELYKRLITTLTTDEKVIGGVSELQKQALSVALTLQGNYKTFDAQIQSMVKSLGSLSENMKSLKSGIDTLTEKYGELDDGIGAYTDAVKQLSTGFQSVSKGSGSIASGASALYEGTYSMVDGVSKLCDGVSELKDGTGELHDGTNEFYEETADMDTEVTDMMDDKISEMTGEDEETISFVSEKNTKVDSVLFVIKTPAIELPEEDNVVEDEEEEPDVVDKFLNLFR